MSASYEDTLLEEAVGEIVGSQKLYRFLKALIRKAGGGITPSQVLPISGAGEFIFRPGQPSSGNAFATEAEVLAAIANVDAPRVGFDLKNIAPAPLVLTMNWAMRLGSWFATYPVTGVFEVQVPEGVQISDLLSIDKGLSVRFLHTATPALISTLPLGVPRVFAVHGGAVAHVDGTVPVVPVVGLPDAQVVSLAEGGGLVLGGATPFVQDAGGLVIGTNLSSSRSIGQSFPNGWVTGSGSLSYPVADASFVEPAVPGFTGVLTFENLIDRAESVGFVDVAPLLVPAPGVEGPTTQEAIDALKRRDPPAMASFGADGLDPGASTDTTSSTIPPGSRSLSVVAPTERPSILATRDGTISAIWARHRGSVVNPAGAAITYAITINGAVVGGSVTVPADVNSPPTGMTAFPTITYAAGDRIGILATVSSPLPAPVQVVFMNVSLAA